MWFFNFAFLSPEKNASPRKEEWIPDLSMRSEYQISFAGEPALSLCKDKEEVAENRVTVLGKKKKKLTVGHIWGRG